MARAGMGAGVAGLCAVRRGGVELAAVAASVRRVWGRSAVAFVVVLAAACVSVPAAQALSQVTEIAFQANTGNLWTYTVGDPGSNIGMGMMAGTSPSVAPLSGIGSNHEIAFQANTSNLWTTGAFGQGPTPYGLAAGTSPSIGGSELAFQADGGYLWIIGSNATGGGDTGLGMMAGTSPSMDGSHIAFQANTGALGGDEGIRGIVPVTDGNFMAAGTSPSVNANDVVAVQESPLYCSNCGGNLVVGQVDFADDFVDTATYTQLGMMAGTSPSINDKNDIAFRRATTISTWLTTRAVAVAILA